MIIEFLGVGEALDPFLGNSSYLISESETKILIDCGSAIPFKFVGEGINAESIDLIHITHFHADHFFGLPALFLYLLDMKRECKLRISGPIGIKERTIEIFDKAYPGLKDRITFELEFYENPTSIEVGSLDLRFAYSKHTVENLAVSIQGATDKVGVSGDGALTVETKELFSTCSHLIHETFLCEQEAHGHASLVDVLNFARELPRVKAIYPVHIQRDERRNKLRPYLSSLKSKELVVVATPGTIVAL